MGKKLIIRALKPLQEDGCRHYWMIESPKGGITKGACKYCGEVKEFSGYGLWTKGDISLELNISTG